MTIPAEAPNAANARNSVSQLRVGASAQPTVLMAKMVNPIVSGGRRPKRSDRVPWEIWPIDKPANQAARVS
jgi:hypothetical protein